MQSIIFSLTTILSVLLQCNCKNNDNFTMIYAVEKKVFVQESDKFNESRHLATFDGDVTGFAAYKGYLYISEKHSGALWYKKNSAIWRVKMTNSTSFGIDYSTWDEFHVMENFDHNILSIAIVHGYIFVGRSDGTLLRCSTNIRNSCANFKKFEETIKKIDYNSADDKIYVHELAYERFVATYRCSPGIPDSCNPVILFDNKVTSVKVAFGVLWYGTETGELREYPLNQTNEGFTIYCENCYIHEDFNIAHTIEISASNKYLYVIIKSSLTVVFPHNYIWRCDPKNINSCSSTHEHIKAKEMGPVFML